MYTLEKTSRRVTWCGRTDTVNYSDDAHTLAVGDGIMLLAVGGELVALEPGGTRGASSTRPRCRATGSDRRWPDRRPLQPQAGPCRAGRQPAGRSFAASAGDHALLVRPTGAELVMPARDATAAPASSCACAARGRRARSGPRAGWRGS